MISARVNTAHGQRQLSLLLLLLLPAGPAHAAGPAAGAVTVDGGEGLVISLDPDTGEH